MPKPFEKIVEDLQFQVPFKRDTNAGDILILVKEIDHDQGEVIFARILSISSRTINTHELWHAELMLLTLPVQYANFLVTCEQLTGREIFTTNGRKIYMKSVETSNQSEEEFREESVSLDDCRSRREARRTPKLTLVRPKVEAKD
ncbi:MAG: hypothetical protein LBJ64_07725 [Deltaproteobacteria bacterium]|jgi:hypothetical protein|nr:hypothetical protein [Deltaproteobacteria bacterium]